jgi:cell division initiation protein
MADITPTDIVNKQFRLGLRGYDKHEVDDFLQQISDSLYKVLEENQRLRAQIEDLRGRVQHFQETEGLIKNALMLAERTADEVRQHAHQEAELIKRQAEEDLRRERTELEDSRQMRQRILAEIRALLNSHLSLIEAQENRPYMTSAPREAGA